MTAVIYARYSSYNQREESIEGQIRECTAYAEKNCITVIKHYIDPRNFGRRGALEIEPQRIGPSNCLPKTQVCACLLYTSDAADDGRYV